MTGTRNKWLSILGSALLVVALSRAEAKEQKKSNETAPPPEPDRVQKPADPAALGKDMDDMKARADEVIKKTERGPDPEMSFQQGALEIYCAMRPRFGPANAWLFNERDNKLAALAQRLGIKPDRINELADPGIYDSACARIENLQAVIAELGYKFELEPINRTALLWTPAPGFALFITDPSREVDWKPPYAGTPAGPPDTGPIKRHPRLTLFLFPPVPGAAVRRMMTRSQPGEPAFYTGDLIGFTLQTPQSHDVVPDQIFEKLDHKLSSSGFYFSVPADAIDRLAAAAGERPSRSGARNGLIWAYGQGSPPKAQTPGLAGNALVWIVERGSDEEINLIFFR